MTASFSTVGLPPINDAVTMGQDIFIQQMIGSPCYRMHRIEYEDRLRRLGYHQWLPISIKDCLREILYFRDGAIALKEYGRRVELMHEGVNRWKGKVLHSALRSKATGEQRAEVIKIIDEALEIAMAYDNQYNDAKREYVYKAIPGSPGRRQPRHPFIRMVAESKIRSVSNGKIGGATNHIFASIIDGIYKDKKENVLIVRCFTGDKRKEAVIRKINLRQDIPGIVWVAEKFTGRKIRTVEFDIVRTKSPSEPRTLMCRSCSGSGFSNKKKKSDRSSSIAVKCDKCNGTGIGGISAVNCDTTIDIVDKLLYQYDHIDRFSYVEKAEKMISRLKSDGNTFMYRHRRHIDDSEIAKWQSDTYDNILIIRKMRQTGIWPKNTNQCLLGSMVCPYIDLCIGHNGDKPVAVRFVKKYHGLVTWSD